MASSPAEPLDESAEETVLADDAIAETVTAHRADAETIVVERVDRTVVVERAGPVDAAAGVTRERPPTVPGLPRGKRRRGMSMPPVAPGYGRGAVDAVGPGAVATYEPRVLADPPPPPAVYPGVEATRTTASGLPSVARRARRTGMLALAAFGAACVVSVAGLIALGFAVFG